MNQKQYKFDIISPVADLWNEWFDPINSTGVQESVGFIHKLIYDSFSLSYIIAFLLISIEQSLFLFQSVFELLISKCRFDDSEPFGARVQFIFKLLPVLERGLEFLLNAA